MKTLIMSVLLVASTIILSPTHVSAIDWTTANQITVAWDRNTNSIASGERIRFVCYLANSITDPNKQNPVEIGNVLNPASGDPSMLITLDQKGSYFFGAKAVLEVEDDAVWNPVSESTISWSDDPQYAQGGIPFGLRFYPAPTAPTGLRPE